MSGRFWLASGAKLGAWAVIAGAFGAHWLREQVDEGHFTTRDFEVFEVAVRYQMYHALALVGVGLLALRQKSRTLDFAGFAFLAGVAIFSGLLYLLVFTGQKWLGMVVPIGGVAFIAGWIALAMAGWRQRE
jgi:uncharacterized membrane protein YgdD (TMEM256/DUF423 family)